MNLNDQVVSLELSKRLKELEVKQKSLFYWIKEDEPYIWYNSNNHPMYVEKFYYSAFTVAELGEMFLIFFNNGFKNIFYEKTCTNSWLIKYEHQKNKYDFIVDEINEAEARAKMLIHLIENKLIQVP